MKLSEKVDESHEAIPYDAAGTAKAVDPARHRCSDGPLSCFFSWKVFVVSFLLFTSGLPVIVRLDLVLEHCDLTPKCISLG